MGVGKGTWFTALGARDVQALSKGRGLGKRDELTMRGRKHHHEGQVSTTAPWGLERRALSSGPGFMDL